jgi:hypothetical protein
MANNEEKMMQAPLARRGSDNPHLFKSNKGFRTCGLCGLPRMHKVHEEKTPLASIPTIPAIPGNPL